jgi:hypothetical protein
MLQNRVQFITVSNVISQLTHHLADPRARQELKQQRSSLRSQHKPSRARKDVSFTIESMRMNSTDKKRDNSDESDKRADVVSQSDEGK